MPWNCRIGHRAGGVECTVTKGIGGSFDEEENHLQGVEE